MVLATIISKSFHNCIETVKALAKYLGWFIATLFVMRALAGVLDIIGDVVGIHVNVTKYWMSTLLDFAWYCVSGWIAYEIFVLVGIFHSEDYEYSASRHQSESESKYDDLSSWAHIASWIVTFAELTILIVVIEYFYRYDDYLGKLTLIATRFISRQTGTGIAFTFVALILYGGAFVCAISSLSLLLPVVKYICRRGLDVFSISRIASILFYTWNVIDGRGGYLANYIGRSIKWQYENTIGYMRYWAYYDGTTPSYVLEHEYILPILATLIFNAIVFYALNRSVKAFGRSLYNVVVDNRRLIEGTVDSMEDHFKERKREVDIEHDEIFATLTWTAYGLPMTGWELHQQYTKLGNVLDDYSPTKIAQYTDNDVQRIKNSWTIIHSEKRIRSVVGNAQVYCKIVDEFGTFGKYIRQLISDDDDVVRSNLRKGKVSLYAKILAADLHYRGFKYIGPAKAGEFLKNNYRIIFK